MQTRPASARRNSSLRTLSVRPELRSSQRGSVRTRNASCTPGLVRARASRASAPQSPIREGPSAFSCLFARVAERGNRRVFTGELDGERRTRTADTTIFSRLPSTGECGRFAAESRGYITSPCSRGFPHIPGDCGHLRHTIANLCQNCFQRRGSVPPRRPPVASPGRDDLPGRATSRRPAPVTARSPRVALS
jgi:hypothetical protein